MKTSFTNQPIYTLFSRNLILTFCIVNFALCICKAGNYSWTGTTSTDWATGTNWNYNIVPSTNDSVTITDTTNNPVLAANTDIKRITMTSGTLDCNGYILTISALATFNAGAINNGTVTCSGTSTITFAGTTFGATVSATGNNILFNGSVFNSTLTAVKKGTSSDNGTGGNIFNGAVTITDSSSGSLVLSNNSSLPDTFNATLTVASRSSGSIYLAHQGTNNVFNGKVTMYSSSSGSIYSNYYGTAFYNDSIVVNSTSTGGEYFGMSTGTCTIASGKNISIGTEGFSYTASSGSYGTLYLKNVKQNGTTALNLTLTGTRATIKLEAGSAFNGSVTVSAPGIFLNGSRFLNKVNLTYTNSGTPAYTINSNGGNYFGDSTTIVNNSGATINQSTTYVDTFVCLSPQ